MRIIFLTYLFLVSLSVFSGGIEKGYEALRIYNYFEAKNHFEKSMKKDSLACAYGLSIIHFRDDNPFRNKGLALQRFEVVLRNQGNRSEKVIQYHKQMGITKETIDTLKNQISAYYFEKNLESENFEDFLIRFEWAQEFDSAVNMLDDLRFEAALMKDNSEAYLRFVNFYPESKYQKEARKRYQKAIYTEQTCELSITSFYNFIQNHPENLYKERAEDQIYELTTADRSISSYEYFIHSFSDNKNLYEAWRKLYLGYMTDLSEERYLQFKEDYPNYPFMGDLEVEFKLSQIKFLPFKQYESWGFIDTVGFIRIKAEYESVEKFREGLAVVSKDDKYGAINKKGDLIIPIKYDELYDFYEGTAVCAMGDYYGMVNIGGDEILKIEYDDVLEMQDGLAIAEKDGLFGYYDINGFEKIEAVYNEVNPFQDGLAIVSKEGMYGIIDAYGMIILDFKFDNLIHYNEAFYAAKTEDGWGILTIEGDTILDFEMDLIQPIYNGFAYFELDGEYGFLNENGRISIEADFPIYADDKQLCYFKNGHAKIKSGDRFGLINEKGRKIIPTIFYGLGYFDKLIPITKGNQWGYCDERANRKIDYQFDMALNFEMGKAIVTKEGKMGLIDETGEFVLEPIYEEIVFLNETYYKLKKNGKFGLFNMELSEILPIIHDELIIYSDVLIQTINGEEVQYFNLERKDFIEIE